MRIGTLSALQAALMLLPAHARAEGNTCDALKARLGSRIESGGVHGYSLEAVPSKTPTPSSAKVIGTCEGGAMKMLYRRFGGSSAASPAVEAAPAPAPAPVKEPAAKAPAPQKPVPAPSSPPTPMVVAAAPAAAPIPAPAPVVAPLPALVVKPAVPAITASTPTVAPAIAAVAAPAPAEPAASQALATATAAAASSPTATASDIAMAASAVELARPADTKPAEAGPLISQRTSEFFSEHWRWIAALALLPLLALLWAWRTHHSAYDEAGLPRGPKLKI